MRRNGKLLVGVLALAGALVVGCSEGATPTEVPSATAPAFARGGRPDHAGRHGAQEEAKVLKRHRAAHESAHRIIGPKGGEIRLGSAGLRVVFPRGALTRPVEIRVSTAANNGVAYEFEPHGLQFRVPVRVEQDLHSTAAMTNATIAASLDAAYYAGDVDAGSAQVLEYRPLSVSVKERKARFTIEHFSGYLISVGRRGR
jgi:hypothetical protein